MAGLRSKFFTVRLVVPVPQSQGAVIAGLKKRLKCERIDVAVAKEQVGRAVMPGPNALADLLVIKTLLARPAVPIPVARKQIRSVQDQLLPPRKTVANGEHIAGIVDLRGFYRRGG